MCSIISFGNVRMSGMGKKLVTSYAAMGVGLAIVLTFGLAAISGILEQGQFIASQQESKVNKAPLAAPAAPSVTQGNAAREGAPAGPSATYSGEETIQKAPATQEETKSYLVIEVPASPFAGFFLVLPYIAAAIVGSVVFVITRRKFLRAIF